MSLFRALEEVRDDLHTWASVAHERVPTGFDFVDRMTQGGVAEGEVALLMAYSGVGKTAIGCNVAVHNRGVPTLFFSLEMQARFILKRLAAIYSVVPDHKIETQLRATGQSDEIDVFVRDYPHFAIIDKPGMSLKDMQTVVGEAEQAWGVRPRISIIDFLELIGGIASVEAVGAVDRASRQTKNFARGTDTATFLLHQLNQGGSPFERVKVKDGRYGGPTNADYVIGAYRPCLDPELSPEMHTALENDLMVQFLKTRGGPHIHPSPVKFHYDVNTMRISPLVPAVVQQQQVLA